MAIYPTLVRLAQEWNTRYPLIDKQGNFGSIAGLPPAAMRYTEARMSTVAALMMDDTKMDTVDFLPTYDEKGTGAVGLAVEVPQPAGQWLAGHRRGHGDLHPAAQSGGGLRRPDPPDRRSRHLDRRVDGNRPRPGLPHGQYRLRPGRIAAGLLHGPWHDHAPRGPASRSTARAATASSSTRCPTRPLGTASKSGSRNWSTTAASLASPPRGTRAT